jgi:periplasmic divalent cation tolerance protein
VNAADPAGYGVMQCAVPNRETGVKIAEVLIAEKLAACIQLLPMESFYRWEGEIENAREVLMLVKTRQAHFDAAIARIRTLHPYRVPEIVAFAFSAGFSGYLTWIDSVTFPVHD